MAAQIGRYAHAKHYRRMRKMVKTLKTRVGRVHREIGRQPAQLPQHVKPNTSDLLCTASVAS